MPSDAVENASRTARTPDLTLSNAGLMPLLQTLEMWSRTLFHTGRMTLSQSQRNAGARVLLMNALIAANAAFICAHRALMWLTIQLKTGLTMLFHSHLKAGARILVT